MEQDLPHRHPAFSDCECKDSAEHAKHLGNPSVLDVAAEAALIERVKRAAKDGDWRAAEWLLERHLPTGLPLSMEAAIEAGMTPEEWSATTDWDDIIQTEPRLWPGGHASGRPFKGATLSPSSRMQREIKRRNRIAKKTEERLRHKTEEPEGIWTWTGSQWHPVSCPRGCDDIKACGKCSEDSDPCPMGCSPNDATCCAYCPWHQ